jgi:hypothetical protein
MVLHAMSWHTVTGVVTVRVATNYFAHPDETAEGAAANALHDYASSHGLGEEGRDYVVMVTSVAPMKPLSPSDPERLEAERKTWENRLPCE